ncbi:MAG: tetratricopeptide repeat protein [Acidobacteriota bacterium]
MTFNWRGAGSLFGALALAVSARGSGYVDSRLCATCHPAIYQSYQRTGMARSFSRPGGPAPEDFRTGNGYYHAASDTWYEMTERDGKYYQRRFQKGPAGEERNVDVKSIDFVLGSGNHARTYLHRTPQGTLAQLPLGWYAEKGGYWAMSPGYDNALQPGSRRPIGYDCMFCHNEYPKAAPATGRFGDPPVFADALPEGIDCQRCHGPGEMHIQAKGDPARIVNPARLSDERQMEVCLQCHLEPDSFRPALGFKRYERAWFSYTPGEPLAAFMNIFDTPDDDHGEDRFQIAGSAYEFRKSACFLRSKGALRCTSCHNPHEEQHGEASLDRYNSVCLGCHAGKITVAATAGAHPASTNCVDCHMQKRRTQDVVHVVMTDHRIRRQPLAGDLLASIAEKSATAIRPQSASRYYPASAPRTPANDLLLAIAQIRDRTNLQEGIPALEKLLAASPPQRPEPWFELAEAERSVKRLAQAIPYYRGALLRDPAYFSALLGLGTVLEGLGRHPEAIVALQRATRSAPADARPWNALGQANLALGRKTEAASDFRQAAALDPDSPDPQNGLGILLAEAGDIGAAEGAFREAIRIQPNAPGAHANLAKVLTARQEIAGALAEFELAVRLAPADAGVRFDYGALLGGLRRFDEATVQLEAATAADPGLAEGHALLGNLRERQGRLDDALGEYSAAVEIRPGLTRAQLDLGAVLARKGDRAGAIRHLNLAAADPLLRELAQQLIEKINSGH